jgi:hypothetical protein
VGRLVKISTNSKLASRDDVQAALTAALEGMRLGGGGMAVRRLDPILFKGIHPSNVWLAELGTREAAQRLARQGQVQSPWGNLRVEEVRRSDGVGCGVWVVMGWTVGGGAHLGRVCEVHTKTYSIPVLINLLPFLFCFVLQVREDDLARLQLGSALGLDACAVHVQGVPASMGGACVILFG